MIDRRSLLLVVAAATLVRPPSAAAGPEQRLLWPDGPPGGGGPSGPAVLSPRGALRNIAVPCLEIVRPQRPNGAAALVAGGGGYTHINMRGESLPAAAWLAGQGVTAFVLSYRLPGEGWANGPLAPLQDAQRALRLIRASVASFGLDPHRIGALGFSAGGHLLGLAAARAGFAAYPPGDATDRLSARPDFAALIYPVVTLQPPFDHTSTRRQLVGRHPSEAASAEWSVETHVRADCPPFFLVQAEDDLVADPQNTRILAAACQRADVPVEMHRFASGGHGFGIGRPGTPTTAWPAMCRDWLVRLGMFG